MNTTLYPLAALFAWAVVISNVRRLPAILREPTRLANWCLYLSFALIFTDGWAVVWNRMDAWTGMPESNTLVAMCLVVCYSASALALLQLWSYPPDRATRRVRFTVSVVAVVLTAMITLFVHSNTTHHLQNSFKDWYGGSVEYEAYLLIYLTTYTTAEVEVIRLCRRYAKVTSPSWLRTGLTTTSIGAAIGLLYSATRVADILAARLDVDISILENVAEVGAGLGALIVMIGLTLHSWGPRMSSLAQRLRRLIAYVQLRPLWASFYALDASIAFDDQRLTEGVLARMRAATRVLGDVEYHVARRVVEIRDGILTLRPYQDPADTDRIRSHFLSRGLVGDDLDAAVAAVQIHAALDAQEAATRDDGPSPRTAGNSPANLDAELAWLLKVAKHFIQKPTTSHELADTDPAPTGGIA
jgi:hypothetical protein